MDTSTRSGQVDSLVASAFEQTHPNVTVVAVGGYGRSELFPYSDVDLLLLTDIPPSEQERGPIGDFLKLLWDQGLRVSQSVHTAQEACEIHEGNLELTISLLDQRLLCGEPARHEKLMRLMPRFLQAERDHIIHHLGLMTRSRHAKFADTIYHLEPNVKEHPGGLRDLHVIHWLHTLRPLETQALDEDRAFLFDVRSRLHRHFKRDGNVLTFEAQEALSEHPETWMREYYRHARAIDRAVQDVLERSENSRTSLIGQFRDLRSRLSNSEFTVSRGRVFLRAPSLLQSDPNIVLQLMQFIARHQLALARDTEVRLRSAAPLRCSWIGLKELLVLPGCVTALRVMTELGILQQIIPEWSRIDCLVVRDFYHRYTIDEHTLVTLQMIEKLASSKDPGHIQFAGLLSEIDRPDLLRFALLLHDIGKGEGTGGHAARSAAIAQAVMHRLGMPEEDQQTILFLTAHHLDLSSLMTSRDLADPSTSRQIAECTGTVERLKLLAVLTYADISAVNPQAMTPWRLEQLWKTYVAGYEEFTRALGTERIRLAVQNLPDAAAELDGLPTRYLKTHTPAQIAGHVKLLRQGTAVDLAKLNGNYQVNVAAPDRAFLLAALSGALACFGMNILKAEAFSNSHGQALNSFIFEDPHRTLELNPSESARLQALILRAVNGSVDIAQMIQHRRKPAQKPRMAPMVSASNEVSDTSTLIEIVAEDRPGLLYDLTQTISSATANIDVVLVDTEANRALDVFYVRADGGKLADRQIELVRSSLLEVAL